MAKNHGLRHLMYRLAPWSIIDRISEACRYPKMLMRSMLMHSECRRRKVVVQATPAVYFLPIHECSIALHICGDLSNRSSPVRLALIEETPKHHQHCWIFFMCGPQTKSIYGFWLFLTSRTLPQMYACLVATNVKPAVVLRIFEWWIGCWHSGGVGQECHCRVWPTTDWNSVRDCPIRHERHSSSNI